ncbi:S1C family serine protease [Variovorax guangxiensis]|uniref:S1C family serine protease n=1 Tax=Variovorax guangxiensis TaxID=1775474 RepID=UPI00285ED06B|nr:S1C family serine protease [Variovorax guangxiensis]MDR6860522.1 S1-C subfamily serine protease [Variovorax guangxiensis]
MTHRIKAVALAALVVGTLQAAAAPRTPEEIFREASPSIWVVLPKDADGRTLGSGSAVIVGPGRLVTNCHVLRNASSITLRREGVDLGAKLEYPDAERDLCQLKADNLPKAVAAIAPTSALRVGQKVYAIGAPRGLEQTLSDGLVSALRRNSAGEIEFIQMSAPISPGSSGGGLFDEEGRLIGITTAAISGAAQNLNFARPAQWVSEIPERGVAALAEFKRTGRSGAASTTPALQPTLASPGTPGQPSPASTPVSGATGRDTYNAERLARAKTCSAEPRAALVAKGAGFETYTIPCSNGDVLAVRCEFGNCRELK